MYKHTNYNVLTDYKILTFSIKKKLKTSVIIAKKMQVFSLSFCHKCMNNGLLIEKHRLLFEKKAKQQKQSKTKELIE